jgi:DNA end-binding protein Ku
MPPTRTASKAVLPRLLKRSTNDASRCRPEPFIPLFDDIPDEKVPKDMLELAMHIVGTKKAHFEPQKFEDQYEDALKELLKKKQSGEKIEAPREREPAKVINLMDALRRSVETERGTGERRKPARRARTNRVPKKAGRSSAGATKKAG